MIFGFKNIFYLFFSLYATICEKNRPFLFWFLFWYQRRAQKSAAIDNETPAVRRVFRYQ